MKRVHDQIYRVKDRKNGGFCANPLAKYHRFLFFEILFKDFRTFLYDKIRHVTLRTGAAAFTSLVFFLYNYRHRRFTFYNSLYAQPLFLVIVFNISFPIKHVIPQYVLCHIIKITAYFIILTKFFAYLRRSPPAIQGFLSALHYVFY